MRRPYLAIGRSTQRRFATFLEAEAWAKTHVRVLDGRGCSESAVILHPDYGTAEVRLDGADRSGAVQAWTDLTHWQGHAA